jgi:hypothetical protein
MKGSDKQHGMEVRSTGREQIFFVPGAQLALFSKRLVLQTYLELPVYQHFNGAQLAGDYNLRFSTSYLLSLSGSSDED